MNVRIVLLTILTVIGASSAAADPFVDGDFQMPFDENQVWNWPGCTDIGWAPPSDPVSHQYHMEWNDSINPDTGLPINKYHMGEDWNGICGSDSDEEAPLFAIADGEVVFVDPIGTIDGQGKQIYVRHSFPYSLADDDLMTVDSGMLHMYDINPVWSVGMPVDKGDPLGSLGGTGGHVPHLHWEMHGDTSVIFGANPYKNPLTISEALRYLPPALVVNDRRDAFEFVLPSTNQWFVGEPPGASAPSSTAFVERDGVRKTFKQALSSGWIPVPGVWVFDGYQWNALDDIDDLIFVPGEQYAFSALVSDLKFVIPIPRNDFIKDRARRDMIRIASKDPRFAEVLASEFQPDFALDMQYERYRMLFKLNDEREVWMVHATYRQLPLYRRVMYFDPDASQWTPWVEIGPNELY